jgi:hypothetical protein
MGTFSLSACLIRRILDLIGASYFRICWRRHERNWNNSRGSRSWDIFIPLVFSQCRPCMCTVCRRWFIIWKHEESSLYLISRKVTQKAEDRYCSREGVSAAVSAEYLNWRTKSFRFIWRLLQNWVWLSRRYPHHYLESTYHIKQHTISLDLRGWRPGICSMALVQRRKKAEVMMADRSITPLHDFMAYRWYRWYVDIAVPHLLSRSYSTCMTS